MDGLTLYLFHARDKLCSQTIVLLSRDTSPFRDVAQTSDCGVFFYFFYIIYKPFMRCRSDVRLWHALSLISVISPLCGVAPTPDCGIIILHFPLEESFRHSFGTRIIIPHFPLEESFKHSFGTCTTILYFPLEGSFRHSLGTSITILQFPLEASFRPSLGTQYLLPLSLIALVNLFMYFMSAFVIPYVRTVLRVLS